MKSIKRGSYIGGRLKKWQKQKRNSINVIRQKILCEDIEVNRRVIHGPDFVAVELVDEWGNSGQGVAVTHWRDRHDPELGLKIAMGRAVLRLAIKQHEMIPF